MRNVARRCLALVAVLATLGTTSALAGTSLAGASTASFCSTQEEKALDLTDASSVRRAATQLLATKPPKQVVRAIKSIKAKNGAKKALAVVAAFVASKCAAAGGSSGSNASTSRCPLSAEQVSSALGATVEKDEASCTYYPPDDVSPNVTFVRQLALACSQDGLSELEYSEPLDGLGEKAYVQRNAVGTSILVCTDSPFEVVVDVVGDEAAALAAAQELAKEVLGS